MAHLEVEPKPARRWWIWVLLIVLLGATAVMLYGKWNKNPSTRKTTGAISKIDDLKTARAEHLYLRAATPTAV